MALKEARNVLMRGLRRQNGLEKSPECPHETFKETKWP